MTRFSRWPIAFSSALLALLLAAGFRAEPAACVQYEEVTTFEMAGLLGRLARLATPDEIVTQHTYCATVHSERSGDLETLVRLDDETISRIDHRRKTVQTITFAELRALWEQRMEEMQAEHGDASGDAPEGEVSVDLDFWVDGPTRHADEETHYDIHVVADVEGSATDEESGETQTLNSQFVLVTEAWRQPQPGYEVVEAFHRAFAEKMSDVMFGAAGTEQLMEALNAIVQNDPRMREGLDRAAQEAQKLNDKGAPTQTITHIVLVPADKEYEPALVFGGGTEAAAEEEKPKKKGRFGRLAKRMAEAASGVDAGGDAAKEAEQRTLASFKTRMQGYADNAPAPTGAPAGYTEQAWEGM